LDDLGSLNLHLGVTEIENVVNNLSNRQSMCISWYPQEFSVTSAAPKITKASFIEVTIPTIQISGPFSLESAKLTKNTRASFTQSQQSASSCTAITAADPGPLAHKKLQVRPSK
jgi:hypothetical protein